METHETFKAFSEESTLHGVKYICQSRNNRLRRFLWVMIMLLMMTGFATQLIDALVKYYKYETFTSVKIKQNNSLTIPSITVCNINILYNSSLVEFVGNENPQLPAEFLEVMHGIRSPENLNVPETAKKITFLQAFDKMSARMEQLCVHCKLGITFLNCSEYFTPIHTDKGICYTFNSYKRIIEKGNMAVFQRGPIYGINLIFDIEPDEYIEPSSGGKGVIIQVHDPKKFPMTENEPIFVGTGTEAFIGLEKIQTKTLSTPYSSYCIENSEKQYKYHDFPYSEEACINDCIFKTVWDCPHCEARSQGSDACSLFDSVACASNSVGSFYDGRKTCACPPLCEDIKYNPTVTYSTYPNRMQALFAETYNWKVRNVNEMKNRYASVNVYFKHLKTTFIEEIPVLSYGQLLSNFGGQMGLYLGASIITIVEFLDFLFIYIIKKMKRAKISSIKSIDGIGHAF